LPGSDWILVTDMPDESSDPPAAPEIRAAPDLAIPLRAGPLRLVFDRGELRWIRLGELEVLRGIYMALREAGWARVPGVIEDLVVEAEPESFRIRFVCRHRRGSIAFDWEARIEGGSDGRIVYAMDGEAGATFLRNRIGFCVLHPAAACAGRPCTVETVDGERRRGAFARLVSPHQLFTSLRAIAHEAAPGVEAEVRMEGESFEMEDQRNWSDASFKTYGTPLASPIPVRIEQGTRIRQQISLCLFGETSEPVREAVGAVPGALPRRRNGVEAVVVGVEPALGFPRPALGLAGAGLVSLDEAQAGRLRALRLDHVRADLQLDAAGWEAVLERAVANARQLELPLELALFLPAAAEPALGALAARAAPLRPRIASWLLVRASDAATADGAAVAAREALSAVDPAALFASGTDRHFVELNRQRPAPAGLDRISFALTPQVHAFDDATLVENLATLPWLAETVRGFAPEAGLAISPITLRPRVDPRPSSSREPGEPPFCDDPRQGTAFAAAWTLGFIASAAGAGFASLSFFELVGPRGVLDGGRLYPVYHALAEILGLPGARVVSARSRRPERVLALALRSGPSTRVFLANVSGETHPVRVEGLVGRARASALGSSEGEQRGFELELAPHTTLRLDVEQSGP
jgi:hypothetical protein